MLSFLNVFAWIISLIRLKPDSNADNVPDFLPDDIVLQRNILRFVFAMMSSPP
jgi:hypothetical protein